MISRQLDSPKTAREEATCKFLGNPSEPVREATVDLQDGIVFHRGGMPIC